MERLPVAEPDPQTVRIGSQIDGPDDFGSPERPISSALPVAVPSGEIQASTVNSLPVALPPFRVTTPEPSVGNDNAVPEAPPSGIFATSVLPHADGRIGQ